MSNTLKCFYNSTKSLKSFEALLYITPVICYPSACSSTYRKCRGYKKSLNRLEISFFYNVCVQKLT